MITAKPSIYNTLSIYNGGSGGGKDESPDIPDSLKKFYTQINSIATNSNGVIDCNDLISYKSSDFIILSVYPWKSQDIDRNYVQGTQYNNHVGSSLFLFRGDTTYSPGTASTWVSNTSSETLIQFNRNIGNLYIMVLKNPYFYINGSTKSSSVAMGTDTSGQCVRIFSPNTDTCWAFAQLKIQDKNSLGVKVKLVPAKEKATGKLGILDTVTQQFFEGNQAGFFEYKP